MSSRLPPSRAVLRHGTHALPSAACPCGKPCRRRQRGTGMIEFSVVAVPVLLLGLGSIETAHWLLTRQVVSLALLEAARAGISNHARPQTIVQAFEKALLPLFPASASRSARQNLDLAFQKRRHDTAGAPWQMVVVSPTMAAFNDFADLQLGRASHDGLPTINNHYLFEQDQRRRAQGWANGLGPESRSSIYQANTLTLRLNYLHEPVVPGMKGLMRLLGRSGGSYAQHAMAHGYLPLSREISLMMQSHPVRWPSLAGNNVIQPEAPALTTPAAILPCTGLWCMAPQPASTTPGLPNVPWRPPASGEHSGAPHTPAQPDASAPDPASGDGLAVTPDHPDCGLTLCCTSAAGTALAASS